MRTLPWVPLFCTNTWYTMCVPPKFLACEWTHEELTHLCTRARTHARSRIFYSSNLLSIILSTNHHTFVALDKLFQQPCKLELLSFMCSKSTFGFETLQARLGNPLPAFIASNKLFALFNDSCFKTKAMKSAQPKTSTSGFSLTFVIHKWKWRFIHTQQQLIHINITRVTMTFDDIWYHCNHWYHVAFLSSSRHHRCCCHFR